MNRKPVHFMHSNLTKLFLIIYSFISACSNEKARFENESKIFSGFMLKEFNVKLGDQKQFYFFVPTYTCIGCNKSAIHYFTNLKSKPNNFLIITEKQINKSNDLGSQKNVFIDKKNKIDRLNISPSSTALIIWERNKIQSIEEITPDNIDSLVTASSVSKTNENP